MANVNLPDKQMVLPCAMRSPFFERTAPFLVGLRAEASAGWGLLGSSPADVVGLFAEALAALRWRLASAQALHTLPGR